jgi:hypothetical protein
MTRGRPQASLWRSTAGVFVGVLVTAALMIGTNVLLVKAMSPISALFLAVTLACAAIYHFAGGYLCAVIARGTGLATAGVILLGTGLLLVSVMQTWARMPPWYSVAMVALAPTALYLGAHAQAG